MGQPDDSREFQPVPLAIQFIHPPKKGLLITSKFDILYCGRCFIKKTWDRLLIMTLV